MQIIYRLFDLYFVLCRVSIHHIIITRTIKELSDPTFVGKNRGKPTLLSRATMIHLCEIAAFHDEQNEGLERRRMISMIIKASGGKLNLTQATNLWQHTIQPLG